MHLVSASVITTKLWPGGAQRWCVSGLPWAWPAHHCQPHPTQGPGEHLWLMQVSSGVEDTDTMIKCTGAHTQVPEGALLWLSATQMPTSVCGTNMSQPPQPWAAWLRLTSQNKSSLTRQAKTHESSEGQGWEWQGVGG